jgi:hypothetical protein
MMIVVPLLVLMAPHVKMDLATTPAHVLIISKEITAKPVNYK